MNVWYGNVFVYMSRYGNLYMHDCALWFALCIYTCITQYGSTVYIGIAMVFVFPPYNSVFTFSFKSIQLLMTIQYRTCQNKAVYEIFH